MKIVHYIILVVFVLEPMGPRIIQTLFDCSQTENESGGLQLTLDHTLDLEYQCGPADVSSVMVSGTGQLRLGGR